MTVLIPAYEPDQRLLDLIRRLKAMTDSEIIVVDDGSGERFREIFEGVKAAGCTVLTHMVNLGKGCALKTGFRYIRERGAAQAVVCADSDGQHAPKDILAVGQAVEAGQAAMVLGSRRFTGKVPLRSQFGNRLTSKIYDLTTGISIGDTQTGLRGYPAEMLDWLCRVPGERFEYEMNLLMQAPVEGHRIEEVPIETIYLDHNKSSHFHPLLDSIKVYLPILKFCASSLTAGLVDFVLVLLLQFLTGSLLASVIGARVGSSAVNYSMNRRFVFAKTGKKVVSRSLGSYYTLAVVILGLNYGLLWLMHVGLGVNLVPAKLATELLLFAVSYWCQKRLVY